MRRKRLARVFVACRVAGVAKCVIFDLDGTLVDSLPGIAASLNRTLAAHGLPGHSDRAVRGFVGDGIRNLILRALPAGSDASLFESMLALYKKDYGLSWPEGTAPYPGIVGMLENLGLRGPDLAVLSNKSHEFTVEIVARVFPGIRFACVEGQRDGQPQKPDPHGALKVSAAAGVAPCDCALVGDSTMDIETALRAGMEAVGVAWGYHDPGRLRAAGAVEVVADPAELSARFSR